MVQKKGKHGVQSGNTLRAINTKHFRKYRREAVIVWRSKSWWEPKEYDFHPAVNIPYRDVPFSLNKQNRWLLPDLIKYEIKQTNIYNQYLSEGFGIPLKPDNFGARLELVERHKLLRNNNCTSIILSAKADEQGKIILKELRLERLRGYCDADNVLNTGSGKNKEIQVADDFFEIVKRVRLEVLYPCELTNILSLKPKVFGYDTTKSFKSRNYNRRPWTTTGYSFRRREAKERSEKITRQIVEDLETYEDEKRRTVIGINGNRKLERRLQSADGKVNVLPVLVCDFILKAFKDKNIEIVESNRKKTEGLDEDEEDVLIDAKTLTDKPFLSEENGQTPSQAFTQPVWILPTSTVKDQEPAESSSLSLNENSLTVRIPVRDADPMTLSESFEHEYLECNCSPRRFVINISKLVSDLDNIGSALKLVRSEKITFCWLVFIHVPIHPLNTEAEHVYKILLKVRTNEELSEIKLESIEENSFVHINTVISKALQHLKHNTVVSLMYHKYKKEGIKAKNQKYRSVLEEMKHWTSVSSIPDPATLVKEEFQKARERMKMRSISEHLSRNIPTIYCKICCTNVKEHLGIAPCFHTFCFACIKKYVDQTLGAVNGNILCPEHSCQSELDLGTLLSIGNIKDVISLIKRKCNISMEKNPFCLWCTNEDCGRIIYINAGDSSVAQCSCGENRCTVCLGRAHWPISCNLYLQYVTKLIKIRDKEMVPHDFIIKYDCKYCRVCLKILKRYDKCAIEFCECSSTLCQRCSLLFHSGRNRCYFDTENDNTTIDNDGGNGTEQTIDMRKEDTIAERTNWYKLAIKHRLQQHPYRMAKMHASAKLMATRLAHYMLKEERKCHFIYLDFETDGHYFTESDKVGKYLEHTVDLYRDVNSYVEYTVVYLESVSAQTEETKSLHRQAMALSVCAKNVFDLCKDGALMNSKSILTKISKTRSEIHRLLEEIIFLVDKLGIPGIR